jgi:hypothetical protein
MTAKVKLVVLAAMICEHLNDEILFFSQVRTTNPVSMHPFGDE